MTLVLQVNWFGALLGFVLHDDTVFGVGGSYIVCFKHFGILVKYAVLIN